jgi:hypothetical protein
VPKKCTRTGKGASDWHSFRQIKHRQDVGSGVSVDLRFVISLISYDSTQPIQRLAHCKQNMQSVRLCEKCVPPAAYGRCLCRSNPTAFVQSKSVCTIYCATFQRCGFGVQTTVVNPSNPQNGTHHVSARYRTCSCHQTVCSNSMYQAVVWHKGALQQWGMQVQSW